MKNLLKYLSEYKKECVLGPLFKLLEALFDLTVPLVTAVIIDQGIGTGNQSVVWKYGGVLLLLAIIGLTCSITAQYFAAKAAVGFAAKLRHALFSHVEKLSFTEIDEIGTSTLITRMTSDNNQVQSGVNMALRLFLRSPFIVLGAMVMAFCIDGKAALVFAVAIPALAVVVYGIMLISMPLYRKVQGALDQVLLRTRENLTGVRVIRAFHREREEEKEFVQKNTDLSKAELFVGRISALTNPLTYVIINIALVVLLWTSGLRIDVGDLSQGQVVALVNYLSQILVELIKLANTIVLTNKSLACAARIWNVLDTKSSLGLSDKTGEAKRSNKSSHNSYHVEFLHAGLNYKGASEPSVEDVCLSVKRGQTIGIIGGTGSGKTSLVHLIPRFYDTTAGEVCINGINVKEMPLEELRSKIGIVMQKAVLFKGTIRENLLWGNENASDEEICEALEISQSMEFVKKKENGIESMIEQGGRNLSGGQKQRLTIARALVRKPEILIFDDSTSALDYATDAALRKGLKGLSYHPTIFMVSQRTSSICHADQILVLDDGLVIGKGTHEELLQTCETYREIHNTQFRDSKEVAKG